MMEIGASAPLTELWEENLRTIPTGSLDPAIEEKVRDGFFAGAAAMLGLIAAEGSPAQRETSLNAAQAELQRWLRVMERTSHPNSPACRAARAAMAGTAVSGGGMIRER
jgi:hypothetical protein